MDRWLLALALICDATHFAFNNASGPTYGCWSIKDQIERLSCFDMAAGPPAPSSRLEVAETKRCGAAAHGDCSSPKESGPSR